MLTKVADALEVVPAAFGILRTTNCAVVPSMIQGANFSRDCDTIASIAATIAGAYEGTVAIPQNWKDAVRAANSDQPDIENLSNGLYRALCAEKDRCATRVKYLQSLLSKGENRNA
jgi:ADP-ribosylglycohydrolase